MDYITHFSNLPLPLYPNEYEADIYTRHKKGKTLLLGYTKQLLHLCDDAMDNNPNLDIKNVIKQDWFTLDKHYDTVIGDGVLNLVGGGLVTYLSTRCDRLIVRFFTEKINGMRYATFFKHNTAFLLPDVIIDTQPGCKILIWNFQQSMN
uniref:Uncharacterized protein n=1 Tax=viral metagenome TaxID=1070528 RepID=A0A6C0C9F6_9ZZZZ